MLYLYAQIAVGDIDAAGPKPFHHGIHETIKSTDPPCVADDLDCNPSDDPSSGIEVTEESNEGMKNFSIS